MKSNSIGMQFFKYASVLSIFCSFGSIVFGQTKAEEKVKNRDFCSYNNYSNGDKAQYKETREMTLPAGSLVNVDGKRNGGIQVKGENRSDVLVRACVQTVGATDEEARAAAKNIRIEAGSTISAEVAGEESNFAVSYEILVPRSANLKLLAHNGGISVNSVEGTIEFATTNGGVNLKEVAGDVKGRTKNGGVNVVLSGNSWKGSGLDVETTNGGVHLTMPENYAALVETGTVNGGFKSEISALKVEKTERGHGASRISAVLNGGGSPIRVITTNGGVKISSSNARNL